MESSPQWNEELENNPGLINEDCYGKRMAVQIKPRDKAELSKAHPGSQAIESGSRPT